mgnify:CR=1 FL=1
MISFKSFLCRIFRRMDSYNEKQNIVWHYICKNGHKWNSHSSPTGSFCADNYFMEETICPECKTTICTGKVYKNGKATGEGSIHIWFIEREKLKRKKTKKIKRINLIMKGGN